MEELTRLNELQRDANRLICESAKLIAEVKALAEKCKMESDYEERMRKLITEATLERARRAALEKENDRLRQKLALRGYADASQTMEYRFD